MLNIDIPGFKPLSLDHLVLDFNGVLALDGKLMVGVHERLKRLAEDLQLHVVTADTFGSARKALEDTQARLTVLGPHDQSQAKRQYVERLGADRTACIGNGRNDRLMLKTAALGIVVGSMEGLAIEAFLAAHLHAPSVHDALDLLESPKRLIATLRD